MNRYLSYGMLIMGALIAMQGLFIYGLRADLKLAQSERDQYAANLNACETNHKINYEVSNDYQKKLTDLNAELRGRKRMWDTATCVPIQFTPRGHHATAPEGKLPENHGIVADALLDFAADAERVRLQLMACQEWINKEKQVKK